MGSRAQAETAPLLPEMSVSQSLEREPLSSPCILHPPSRVAQAAVGTAASHPPCGPQPPNPDTIKVFGRCGLGVLLEFFIPQPLFGETAGCTGHVGQSCTLGHDEVGRHQTPTRPTTAEPPRGPGSCLGLRKSHLLSKRSCQVFFKGLQLSRDQIDVEISLESQIYP